MDQRNHFENGSVIWNLRSTTKYDAIREVIHDTPVFRSIDGFNITGFEEKVIARERLQSTGFGHGVAVAHGRIEDVDGAYIALGVSPDGIDFDAVDGKPVHLLFVVATHPGMPMDYLRILSTLVGLVRNEGFRTDLLGCACREDVEHKLRTAFNLMMAKVSGEGGNLTAGNVGSTKGQMASQTGGSSQDFALA